MTLRIVVDMQAAQTGSRLRGIGRYVNSLIEAMVKAPGDHQIILLLSDLIKGTVEPTRARFQGLIPQSNIHVWQGWGPTSFESPAHNSGREVSEVIRESVLLSLQPDVVFIPSLFEAHDTAFSIGKVDHEVPVVTIAYDFIPWHIPTREYRDEPNVRAWYRNRLEVMRASDHILSISEHTRHELIDRIGIPPQDVTTIMAGCSPRFTQRSLSPQHKADLLARHGIDKPFIMLAGSLEPSKNLRGFLQAMGTLPAALQQQYQIVLAGTRDTGDDERMRAMAPTGPIREALRITGHVPDDELIDLYNCCHAFVFPSLREGFGLPPLEAMACGAPAIGSNTTSLPEVFDNPDALFDPQSIPSMAAKIAQVLTDEDFRARLSRHGLTRAEALNWQACATKALGALRKAAGTPAIVPEGSARVLRPEPLKRRPLRILVQKLDHAGDFLLALPAIAKLRARYPHAEIDGLIGEWNRTAAEFANVFDKIYTLDFFKAKSSVSPKLDMKSVDAVRDTMMLYDYAIDLRRMIDTREILVQMPALKYFGYKVWDERINNILTDPLPIYPEHSGERDAFDHTHISEQMLRLIDILPYANSDYIAPPTPQPAKVKPGSIGIFPRVGTDSRQWDSDRFVELVRRLAADPLVTEINLFGVTRQELDEIGFAPDAKIVYRVGLKFDALVAQLAQCAVCVGNNSFGVHLGSWAGCPVVAIYSGHETPEQWAPPFGHVEVITADVVCSPCHLPTRESCTNNMICLTRIDVETVLVAIRSYLGDATRSQSRILHRRDRAECRRLAIRAISRLKFTGRVSGIGENEHARNIVMAALSHNFPDVRLGHYRLFVDISMFIESLNGGDLRSATEWQALSAFVEHLESALPRNVTVQLIAAGAHDHEFYTGVGDPLSQPQRFFAGDRKRRIVVPVAGDIYLGFDSYPTRNVAIWTLLSTWRQNGVRTAFRVSGTDLPPQTADAAASRDIDVQNRINYLRYLLEFDTLIVPDARTAARLRQFSDRYAPLRDRQIEFLTNDACPDIGGHPASIPETHNPDAMADLVGALTDWLPAPERV